MTFLKHQNCLQFFLPMIQHCNFLQKAYDLYHLATFELSKTENWFEANKLTLNVSKTKHILFKKKKEDVNTRDVNDSVTLRKMYVFVCYVTIIRNVYMYF